MLNRATVIEHFQKLPERFSIDEAIEVILVLYNLEKIRLPPTSGEALMQGAEVAEADIATGRVHDLEEPIEAPLTLQ